jgi:hypothetical protein
MPDHDINSTLIAATRNRNSFYAAPNFLRYFMVLALIASVGFKVRLLKLLMAFSYPLWHTTEAIPGICAFRMPFCIQNKDLDNCHTHPGRG